MKLETAIRLHTSAVHQGIDRVEQRLSTIQTEKTFMPRKTANSTINQPSTTVERVEAIDAFHAQENPFENEELVKLLDQVAIPVAHETVRKMLPHRVEHHIQRLLASNDEADRKELFEIMKSAKLAICFSVYHSVLAYARESSQAQLNGSTQETLPVELQEE